MIVTCTQCQAKFRVADEKVGPRGVKVRCSKCQNVFPVRRDPEPPQDAPAPAPAAPAIPPPLPRSGGLELDLEGRARAAPDPFADPFGGPPPDPFAARPSRIPDDPFAPASAPAPDPFLASVPAPPSGAGASALPVTDLADLLGAAAGVEAPLPAAGPGAPFAAETAFGAVADLGLALEDRTTPPPLPTGRRDPFSDDGGADTPFGAPGSFSEDDPIADEPPAPASAFGAIDLSTPTPMRAPAPPPRDAPPAPRAAPVRPAPAPPARPALPPEDAAELAERVRRRRAARLRSIAVNAVSLAVLLLASLALVAVWRGDGPRDLRALRPSALVGALGGSRSGQVTAVDVTNGLYERGRGAPLLFVRGRVVSRAPGPLPAVRVAVEVVRGGTVVARGEALAGALPTPEELYGADDAAALAVVSESLRARATRPVRPGEPVPFVVAIADYPADLSGASLRVAAGPEGERARP